MKYQNETLLLAVTIALIACSSNGQSSISKNSLLDSPTLIANKAMNDEGLVMGLPSDGGFYGSLYVQPRSSMIAPDTQMVGCSQYGNGALGIASYISQPSWISQPVLFQSLNVPARYFTLGFPLQYGGSAVPVYSYFAIDVTGVFHLGPNDPAGYYQFSVIADDTAEIRHITGDSGASEVLVDDQKPAGPNGGCLEQTQAAHMSCSSSYADQSASKIKTVYLEPGQNFPLQVRYWQGPGQGIAMVAMYRHVNDPTVAAQVQDSACGKELNFRDGGSGMTDVLSRWKVISFDNLKR